MIESKLVVKYFTDGGLGQRSSYLLLFLFLSDFHHTDTATPQTPWTVEMQSTFCAVSQHEH